MTPAFGRSLGGLFRRVYDLGACPIAGSGVRGSPHVLLARADRPQSANRSASAPVAALAALVATAAVYMVESSHPARQRPRQLHAWGADDFGRLRAADRPQRVGFARCRIAVAPFGKIFSRAATSSAIPSCCRTFATWMPAVDALVSGTKIASAASNASRKPAASATLTMGSPARTAIAVSTRPISAIEARTTQILVRQFRDHRRRQNDDVGGLCRCAICRPWRRLRRTLPR